jgi:adhesin/invasin
VLSALVLGGCSIDQLLTDPGGSKQGPAPVASRLGFVTQPASTVAGQVVLSSVAVAALDQAGQRVAGYGGQVTVALTGSTGGATLQGTLTRTAVDGVATFDDLSLSRPGTGYRLEARATGLSSATSDPFNVSPGLPARVEASGGGGQVDTVAATLGSAYEVLVTDAFGNPLADIEVDWTVTSGRGTIEPATKPTAANGTARAVPTMGTEAGAQRGTATLSGHSSGMASFTATAEPGQVAQLRFVQQPTSVKKDERITPAVEVDVADQFGNRATDFTGEITMTLTPLTGNLLGRLRGKHTVDAVDGLARFSDLRIDRPGTNYQLRATAQGLVIDSQPFRVY